MASQDNSFNQEVERIVRQYYPAVRQLQFVEPSADNMVAIADQRLVFRFPRNELATRRLRFEAVLLQRLAGVIQAVAIPKIIALHNDPPFVVAEYIGGAHFSAAQIQSLPAGDQAATGRNIATFMAELQGAVTGEAVRQMRVQTGTKLLHGPWEEYFASLFTGQPLPPGLQPIVDAFYARWQENIANENRSFAIHDDLHVRNILFTGNILSGILDFGDANKGGAEEELRWVYLMGGDVLPAAIARYQELTGRSIDYEHVRVWAIMQELAAVVYGLHSGQTAAYPFQRAQANLRAFLPGFPL